MKLRNKKTGEIKEIPDGFFCGDNLKKICGEWEDYEEPKEYWYIYTSGLSQVEKVTIDEFTDLEAVEVDKQIGNYFETKEEAEKAVEKLKAWKRLKDHNLRVERGQRIFINTDNKLTSQKPLFVVDTYEEVNNDLDLLFGGEE